MTDFGDQFLVPGLGEVGADGESSSVLIEHDVPFSRFKERQHPVRHDLHKAQQVFPLEHADRSFGGHCRLAYDPQPGRPVCQRNGKQPFIQMFIGGLSGHTRRTERLGVHHSQHADTHADIDHVFFTHAVQDAVNLIIGVPVRFSVSEFLCLDGFFLQHLPGDSCEIILCVSGTLQFLKGCILREHIFMPGEDQLLLHIDDKNRSVFCRGVSNLDHILALLQDIGRSSFVIGSKPFHIEPDLQVLLASGTQFVGLCESHQSLVFLVQFAGRETSIDLDRLLSFDTSGVEDIYDQLHFPSVQFRIDHLRFETGVGQPVSEMEPGLHAERVEITVPDIDALFVVLVLQISVKIGKLTSEWDIRVLLRPGVGKFPGEALLTCEDIREGGAALLSSLSVKDDGDIHVIHGRQIHGRTGVDDQHQFLKIPVQELNIIDLARKKIEIPLRDLLIRSLSGLSGYHIDRRFSVAVRDIFFTEQGRCRGSVGIAQALLGRHARIVFDPLLVGLFLEGDIAVEVFSAGDHNSGILQPLRYGDRMTVIRLSGSCSSLDRMRRSGSVQRYFTFQGKRSVVSQENEGFHCSPVGNGGILLLKLCHLIVICSGNDSSHLFPSLVFIKKKTDSYAIS